jgi:hypothetical protein
VRSLLAFIDLLRADLAEASAAIERGEFDSAVEKFADVAARIECKVEELRA